MSELVDQPEKYFRSLIPTREDLLLELEIQTIAEHKAWRSIPLFSFLPLHSPENDALCLALRC